MTSQQAKLKDKIVLVTGGNSGIGFAVAKRVVEDGGRVIITGRDLESLRRAASELGAQAEAVRADVANLTELTGLFDQIKQKYGRLDGLVANAGIAKFATVETVSEEAFDELFDVNVKGVYFTLQKAAPLLSPGASVVLTGSVTGSTGSATSSVYGATKAALRSFARTFSASYIDRGIRFNVVSPGPIETPIWNRPNSLPTHDVEGTKKAIASTVPAKRYGTPEEVAAPIAFLLSSESSYIVGTELFVDGGMSQL